MRKKFRKRRCRRCGSHRIPILYGFPSPKMLEMVAEGQAKLGGCVIGSKTLFCPRCDDEDEIIR